MIEGLETQMSANDIAWPRKSRELHNHNFDTTIWNELDFRNDGIVIRTCAKSGKIRLAQGHSNNAAAAA